MERDYIFTVIGTNCRSGLCLTTLQFLILSFRRVLCVIWFLTVHPNYIRQTQWNAGQIQCQKRRHTAQENIKLHATNKRCTRIKNTRHIQDPL